DPRQVGVLASVVAGGHALGTKINAPNLDSEQLVRAAWGLGCDLGEGFALGRPASASELGEIAMAELPRQAKARPAARILRLTTMHRPRIAVGGTFVRLGSAAALVAAGMLAGSVPLGHSTLGALVAGYITSPATSVLTPHPAAAPGGSSAQGGAARQSSSGGSSGGSQTSGGGGAGHSQASSGSGTSAGGTGSSGGTNPSGTGLPLPLPSSGILPSPTPLPTPKLPIPTPSSIL